MRRREFIAGLASAAAWPAVARAQQPATPVIGFLSSMPASDALNFIDAFRRGLGETEIVEGRNVTIEYRWADNQYDRLPALAADLVRRRVAVIAAPGSAPAALAAKAATATIPIVFGNASDPVKTGLVASLNHPGGNITGFSEMNMEVGAKRLEFLRALVPHAARFGMLLDPKNASAEFLTREVQTAAATIGRAIEVITASTDGEIDAAFADLEQKRVEALVISPSPLFFPRRVQLVVLAARYAVPAIYWDRVFPDAGGLMSYGSSVMDMARRVGVYAGMILKGAKPADLPVMQPTKFELVINLKTAKALGLTIPETLLATADEVIQ
jgi:putative ABC transport system substrate-binding protein